MSTASELENGMSLIHSTDRPFVFNLSNSIIGITILALPFCFKECGLILGLFLLLGSAWITDVTCHLLMKAAIITKRRSYEFLALHMFGIGGKFTIEISIIGLLIGTCIAFYIIIGDLGPAIVSTLTGLENSDGLRIVLLVGVTLFGVLPLAMMENLDRLSHFSAISLTFYSCFALHVVSSAFTNFFSGVWIKKIVYWNPDGLFKCLPIFALSYSCQTQLFIINEALPEPSLKRMNVITRSAVSLVTCLYVVVGVFGYIAFYDDDITGDVLMNFRPTLFSEIIKLGFVISTIISFPLVIFPCRASIYTLLFAQPHNLNKNFDTAIIIPSSYFKLITIGIVAFTLCIGIIIPNVEFMLAITGATMGSLICYIFPAIMSMTIASLGQGKQKLRAQFVLFVGVAILLASTYTTLSAQERLAQQESVVKMAEPIVHKDEVNFNVVEPKHERRQEPPNPHEPLEQVDHPALIEVKHPTLVDSPSVEPPVALVQPQDKPLNDAAAAHDDQVQVISQTTLPEKQPVLNKTMVQVPSSSNISILNKPLIQPANESAKVQLLQKDDDKGQKWAVENGELAKNLLDELRKQQEEQKLLLQEQRQIVDELKLHQMEIHKIDDKHWHEDNQHVNLSSKIVDKPIDKIQQAVTAMRKHLQTVDGLR